MVLFLCLVFPEGQAELAANFRSPVWRQDRVTRSWYLRRRGSEISQEEAQPLELLRDSDTLLYVLRPREGDKIKNKAGPKS